MNFIGKSSIRHAGGRVCIVLVIVFAMLTAANAQPANSSPQKPADQGAKHTDYIEVIGRVLSVDPIKGDVVTRLEFFPHGKFEKEDGTLAKTIKFDTVSSNGKQEITFEKGKRIPPSEVVLDMYDGDVSNYPFDTHKANLVVYFTIKPDKPADKPKPAEEKPEGETKPAPVEEEDDELEVPFTLAFTPSMPGYTMESANSKDSDDTYVDNEITIARSGMVKLFSVFIILLMWGVSIAVVCLVFTVVILKRKAEIAMFSFIATLIFAFVTVRGAQPGVPPVGTFSDTLSFFWVEGILGLCLLSVLLTWIFRKPS